MKWYAFLVISLVQAIAGCLAITIMERIRFPEYFQGLVVWWIQIAIIRKLFHFFKISE